ncbi:MAG: O-antigen ligase family protein [Dethiobacteria bacterium]
MHRKEYFLRHRYVLIALQVLVVTMAALFSITRETTMFVSLRSLFFLLLVCSLSAFLSWTLETFTRFCFCLGLAGTFMSIVTLASVVCLKLRLNLLTFAIGHPNYLYGLPQVTSCFGNPNTFGIFLVFCIVSILILFALYREKREKNRLIAVSFYIVLALQLSALFLTFSRAAFIALALFASCFIWFNGRRYCYLPMVLALAPILISKQTFEKGSMTEVLNALSSGRIKLWAEALKLFIQHPLFGTGLGSWFTITGNHLSVHNTYLHLAVELGLAGLTLYLVFIALFLRDIQKKMNQAVLFKSRYIVLSGLYSLCIGLLVHQLFESYLYHGLPLFLFAVILLYTPVQESGTLYHFRKSPWREQGTSLNYRKAG